MKEGCREFCDGCREFFSDGCREFSDGCRELKEGWRELKEGWREGSVSVLYCWMGATKVAYTSGSPQMSSSSSSSPLASLSHEAHTLGPSSCSGTLINTLNLSQMAIKLEKVDKKDNSLPRERKRILRAL